jgi:hypothetical protein
MMLAITGNSEPHSEERRVRTLAEVEKGHYRALPFIIGYCDWSSSEPWTTR